MLSRQTLNYHGPLTQLIDAWALAFEPDPDILAQAASLSVQRALFTNNGPMLDACLSRPLQAVKAAFDTVICSWYIGARKPDASAFQHAAQHLGMPPSSLLLLDDSVANIEAAIRQGWHGEQVRNGNDVRAALAHYDLVVSEEN